MDFHIASVALTYSAYTAQILRVLSEKQPWDPTTLLLLESADITTRAGEHSLAVLTASMRLTCMGNEVSVQSLTASGEAIRQDLEKDLAEKCHVQNHRLIFEPSQAIDEKQRLLATSTVEALRYLQQHPGLDHPLLPLVGGVFAFDYLETFESLPAVMPGANTCPDYQFVVAEILLSVDHVQKTAELVGIGEEKHFKALCTQMDELAAVLEEARQQVENAQEKNLNTDAGTRPRLVATADMTDAEFTTQVERLKEFITQGDIYQVVPARAFRVSCDDAPGAYLSLKHSNPSPYMFFMMGIDSEGKPFELFGASPESNLKYDAAHHNVTLYPIAGTRPRGRNADGSINHELDIRAELELRTDAKEIAEHTMLVDLARNDVARVSAPGSRHVTRLLDVDRYQFVMHLVSQVSGRLQEGLDALDAYRACMNMGTLTGAPKIRAAQLLRLVEGKRRGSYGGAIGYIRGDGSMDTCIVIRSAFVQDATACVQAGAGVVRDSNPQSEADETLNKARAVLEAIAASKNATLEVIR